ncbi:NYN domain-containing protein [Acinetobacter towneri]|uniref:NYN domain-containing protein n=1 Tax=Acinetobacter towneri TaxID=202956 RepID=A0AB35M4C8_9GAMM|nr:NYN domain-containing protein [Acinetobacter towneri]MDM1719502.1 NYN domain-containing protein [Acinetobacter towneri]MDM1731616.1 NYN domain-containing protein [Acinetobacter towneri]MDM1734241.1 NYN domain-containing protein [Acinetobacter towneri]MDM1737070.1 NYN domain-containing protein [Acinetobacter towneri]MDM1739531.1 NYN domain-containing protein [Acinetobacter towneri]
MELKPKKFAILIDADNSSVNSIESVLEEVAKYGIASVKRVYGDWSSESLKNWRDVLLPHAITPVQQFAYTKSKDATDMILIIDAMDLLYSGALDGFCIVSSDSDFTPLASRIRESGLIVYGFGRSNTPEAFRKACDKFIYVENLVSEAEKAAAAEESDQKEKNNKVTDVALSIDKYTLNLIYKAVKENADDSGWAYLGAIGTYISSVKPDFDTRNYGYDKLSGLIKALGLFETKLQGSQMYLRKRSFSTFVKLVQKTIQQLADQAGWAKTSEIIQHIEQNDPYFNIQKQGFENTQAAILSIHSGWLEFSSDHNRVKVGKLMS